MLGSCHLSKVEAWEGARGQRGQAIVQTGRSPGSFDASPPHSADSYVTAPQQGTLSPLLGVSFLTTIYTLNI